MTPAMRRAASHDSRIEQSLSQLWLVECYGSDGISDGTSSRHVMSLSTLLASMHATFGPDHLVMMSADHIRVVFDDNVEYAAMQAWPVSYLEVDEPMELPIREHPPRD